MLRRGCGLFARQLRQDARVVVIQLAHVGGIVLLVGRVHELALLRFGRELRLALHVGALVEGEVLVVGEGGFGSARLGFGIAALSILYAIGTIIEAELDKGRGAVATVLVQTGTLRVGDTIVVGDTSGRVRAMENDLGKRVTKAGPATAVVLLGLSEVPAAGDILRVVKDEKAARAMVDARKNIATSKAGEGPGRATLEDLYRQIQAGQAKELRIILKTDVSGSLGAITHALDQLDQVQVRINVLHQGAGDITDNDILLASASNAIVVGFSTRITETARRAAVSEGVDVRLYDIIYKLTDDIEKALSGLLEPEIIEVVEGRAEVRKIIRIGRNAIAGSYVTDGRLVRSNARVWRGGKIIATDRIESLRRFRDDVREVQKDFECGIGLANFNDFVEGDIIEAFSSQTVSRSALA